MEPKYLFILFQLKLNKYFVVVLSILLHFNNQTKYSKSKIPNLKNIRIPLKNEQHYGKQTLPYQHSNIRKSVDKFGYKNT